MSQANTRKSGKHNDKHQRFQQLLAQGGREGGMIALLALAIYLGMALLSYNPADPGWASIGHTTQATNDAGRTGAWFASLFINFFGKMAYIFPVLVAYQAVMLFARRHEPMVFHAPLFFLRVGGFILILLAGAAMLSLYSLFGLEKDSGGVIGEELSAAMVGVFNLPASTVLLIAIFLFSLTIFTGVSWFWLMDRLGSGALTLAGKLKNAFSSRVAAAPKVEKKPAPESKAAESKPVAPEPPVVRDRIQAEEADKPPKQGLFRRLFKRKPKTAPLARKEPQIGSLSPGDNNPGPAMPVQAKSKPAPLTASGGGRTAEPPVVEPAAVEKAPKISPFKRNNEQSKRAGKEAQPSLFGDDDSPIPPISLLDAPETHKDKGYSQESLEHMSRLLEEKLLDFGVTVEVVEVNPGPVITRFEIKPAAGVKVSRISNLVKDLARSLAVFSVRVVEVIPGKSVVGIEIPNEEREMVRLSEVLLSRTYDEAASPLTLALGNDIGGNPMVANLAKMPHLLVAGTTGSGKSVGVNAMILSILLKATPEEVRLIMVDPKMLELSIYEGIPHLLTPVVTDMKEAANALRWCVAEMERRYKLMATLGVRNVAGYNRKVKDAQEAGEPLTDPFWKPEEWLDDSEQARPELETLPFIVVVIDEFADMMMIVGKKVEELIARIAQKARAAGIHLILATQRPSVDVITGLIKANIPTRISFQVSSKIDSRTILDQGGAEQLLGHGDMLYLPPGSGMPVRVHGAYVDDDEVHRVVQAWKDRGEPDYLDEVLNGGDGESVPGVPNFSGDGDSEQDSLFDEAVAFVTESRRVSISSVQRKFKIGYNRAANLVEGMEAAGVVSAAGHNGAREVLAAAPPRD
ncbi:DNA translocase FtsK [Hydrocarboniclastica marina]|uniref:DNA translocase FtsK n=1 Tax=Hydrocarboniclastica marina TaxID=2259620 RepID=A0A4V1D8S4_9ALTE|nr:DNA translocase FtsK [Hydrocarboniclastica marina]QCF26200.1 DNA translocase FtsK [Hydrocarboniclastica marina]